jgi:hypothetical protein
VTAEVQAQTRPAPPRRTWTMALPLLVAVAAMAVGGITAGIAGGLIWGAIGGLGLIAALAIGQIAVSPLDRAMLVVAVAASTALATVVLPAAPEVVDVLLCTQFALAFTPAALASAVVAKRHGANFTAAVNAGIAWLHGGRLRAPRRGHPRRPDARSRRCVKGVEPIFGRPATTSPSASSWEGSRFAAFLSVLDRLPALAAAIRHSYFHLVRRSQRRFQHRRP